MIQGKFADLSLNHEYASAVSDMYMGGTVGCGALSDNVCSSGGGAS